jgi:microcystin-dependent protein
VGGGHIQGQKGGQEQVALSTSQMPGHSHAAQATSDTGSVPIPTGNVLADSAPNELYHAASSLAGLNAGTIANAGAGQGHNNMQPYIALNFCIALRGIFPSRN